MAHAPSPLSDVPFDALTERVAETMRVATADASGDDVDRALPEVLRLLRDHMGMDVVFVSAFIDARRVFRHVVGSRVIQAGASDPIEQSWCHRVVMGRLPEYIPDVAALPADPDLPLPDFPIGTHLSTPIVLRDGRVYGTLCCFSFGVNDTVTAQNLRQLRFAARLAAQKLDQETVLRQLSRQAAAPGDSRWNGKTA